MNHVHTEEQRNAQAALLYGNLLHFADFVHTFKVEQTAHLTFLDFFSHVAALSRAGHDFARYGEVELAEFLLKGHLRHQIVDKLVHLSLVGFCRYAERGKSHHEQ